MQQINKFTEVWHMWFFAGALIWYHKHIQTHTQRRQTTHSGANRLTHPYTYILAPPAICSQQLSALDYSRKYPNRWDWEYTFLKKPLEFLDLSLYPWKFQRKQAFTPRNSAKLYDIPWKIQGQKSRPMEIPHDFFQITAGNSIYFLIDT